MTGPLPRRVGQTATAIGSTVIQAGGDVITGDVFVGRFARLRDVWLDPRQVFDEVDVDRFVGRDWLTAGVDRFLRSHDRGYVVVEAAAGLGKSAFAAWLARERDWPCHFTRRRRGRVTATALRNLAVQLIARFHLDDRFAPGGMLPDTAGEPGWFDQVLHEAAAVARAAGERLVVVVDGLDEAEHVAGDLPLGLPSALPAGVFFVVTCRTGTDLPALRRPWQALSITAGDRRNTADLHRFLTDAAREEPLASVLARRDVPVKSLVRDLVERCGGVWVYSRYVLDEIRYGLRSPAELDLLPGDLVHYYFECLSAARHETAWTAVHLPVLGTLAAAAEPLTVDSLARLAGVADRAAVRALCVGRLRPFLAESADGGGRRYGIYHASMKEFLAGALPDHVLDGVRSRVEELAAATREADDRIVDHYLDVFGGLDKGLAHLGADPRSAGVDGGYARRHLTHHLARAGRFEDLHRLLACEQATGPDTARNVWFAAHDAAGTVDDYLADVSRARRHAEAETNARVAARRTAPSIGSEFRYALITAGVTTLTANVPVPLLVRLVESGVWPHTRALAHARQLHKPGDRARASTGLLDHLPEPLKAIVAAEARSAVHDMPEDELKVEALCDLAPHLPERERARVLADAFTTVRGIPDEQARAEAMALLLPHLPDSSLPDVLAAARALAHSFGRAEILAELAPRLPADSIAEALALAHGIPSAADRAWALHELAPHAPDSSAVAREAMESAMSTEDPWDRVWVLTGMATRLDGAERAAVVARALAAARKVDQVGSRVVALGMVADRLPEPERDEVIAEAVAAATTAAEEEESGFLLAELAHRLRGWSAELLAAARGITNASRRVWALGFLVPALPEAERGRLVSEALEGTAMIDSEWRRAGHVARLAPHLTEAQLVRAVAEVKEIDTGFYRTYALGELAPHLPDHLLGQALSAAQTITDEDAYARLITEMAARLPVPRREPLLRRAREIARGITSEHARAEVLARLARHVDESERTEVLAEALTAARAVPEPIGQAWSIAQVAARLPPLDRGALLAESRTAADRIGEVGTRAWVLGRLATMSPESVRDDILADAVRAARTIPVASYRTAVLIALAAEMRPPRSFEVLAEAVSLAKTFGKGDSAVARALGRLVRYTPERVLTGLLAGIRAALGAGGSAWESENPQHAELARHVPHLPERLIREALDATRALPGDYDVTPIWGAVALHLTGALRERAIAEVETARGGESARRTLLRQAGALWGDTVDKDQLDVVRRMLNGLDFGDCQRVLAQVPPVVYDLGGDAVDRVLDAVDAVRRWWTSPDRSVDP